MGFDCLLCGEREIWAFESEDLPRVCKDCEAYMPEDNLTEAKVIKKTYWVTECETYFNKMRAYKGIRPEGVRPTQISDNLEETCLIMPVVNLPMSFQ